jgi:hypothetical protein
MPSASRPAGESKADVTALHRVETAYRPDRIIQSVKLIKPEEHRVNSADLDVCLQYGASASLPGP